MDSQLLYLLKVSAATTLFYICYLLFFRTDTFYVRNRIYLILTLLFPLVIPIFKIPVLDPGISMLTPVPVIEMEGVTSPGELTEALIPDNVISRSVDYSYILLCIYCSVTVIMLSRIVISLINTFRIIRKGTNGTASFPRIIISDKPVPPFSFFPYAVIPVEYYESGNYTDIIDHEFTHIRQGHTFDLLLSELFIAFQWFNPFIWFINRSIILNHEYLADHASIGSNSSVKDYQYRLLNFQAEIKHISLAHTFNSQIKNRIIMINKKPTRKCAMLKNILIIPIVAILGYAFATPEYQYVTSESDPLAIDEAPSVDQKEIMGIVITEDGKPLEKVLIMNTGTMGNAMLATTGQYGKFSITNIQDNASLMFTCKGYISQTIKAADLKTDMIIKMVKDPASKSGLNAVPPKIFPNRTLNIILGPDNRIFWYPGLVKSEHYNNLPPLQETNFSPDGIRQLLLDRNRNLARKINDFNNDIHTGKIIIPKDSVQQVINRMRSTDNTGPVVLIKAYEGVKYKDFVDIQDEMNICGIAQYMFVDIAWYEKEMVKKAIASSAYIASFPPQSNQ